MNATSRARAPSTRVRSNGAPLVEPQKFQPRNFILREALRLAEDHGVSQQDVLERLGAERASLLKIGGMLPASASMEAIEIAAELSGQSDFGLQLGTITDERILGSIMVFLAHCTSLAQVCGEVSNYMHVLYAGVSYGAPSDGRDAAVQFDVLARTTCPLPHYTTSMLVLPVRLFRQILGPSWSPAAVHMAHARLAPMSRYTEVFGCGVTFDAPTNAINIAPADWRRPVDIKSTRVQEVVNDLLDVAEAAQVATEDSLLDRIKEIITTLLPTGDASARRVAELLDMPMRSMQRGIAERGTTFTDLRRKVDSRLKADTQ
jgi:hypothetical protein